MALFRFYYPGLLLASLIMTTMYMFMWKKHDDVHITLFFTLAPMINLGYLFLSTAQTLNAALNAIKITYISCFVQMIIVLAIFGLCRIEVKRWVKLFFMIITTLTFLSTLTIGHNTWFYKDAALDQINGVTVVRKVYGPLHSVLYAVIILFFIIGVAAIIYSRLHKRQISRRVLNLLFLPQIVCMISFFGSRMLFPEIEVLPAAYCFAGLVYLLIVRRINLYDVTDIVIDSLVQEGDTGFITFDRNFNYLGSNETARKILPQLGNLAVDLSLGEDTEMEKMILPWLNQYVRDPGNAEANGHFYEKDGKIYLFTVGELPGKKSSRRGYRIVITDDTLDRAYINLLDGFNRDLKEQVAKKTADVVRMNDNMILGMAVMVESRDNSTGGHIRRTSDVVRMLVDALKKEGRDPDGYNLTEDFCKMLIKAAPMHDLGKIAVDDEILRKPGRFTPEEFEKMKAHAAEGARIVHEILKGTDDVAFHHLAENVAHYHHERWDGSGYPMHLKGEQIPPEARIMAVADVYDALVSKRVYKDKMSFEQANSIIMNGMGSQFDPALKEAYLAARPALEAYYSSLEG